MAEKKETVEAAVRTIRRVTRKKYSAEEKARIVLPQGQRDVVEGLRAETSVDALCRREGIPSNLYSRRTPRSAPPGMLREAASTRPAAPCGCARGGETAGTVYRWSKDFLEAGKQRLVGDSERQADGRQVNEMRAEL